MSVVEESQVESRRGGVQLGRVDACCGGGRGPVSLHVEKESLWTRHGQLICAIVAGVLLLVAKIVGWTVGEYLTFHILVGVAFALGFYFGALAAWGSLKEKKLDINLLMVLGAVLAIF